MLGRPCRRRPGEQLVLGDVGVEGAGEPLQGRRAAEVLVEGRWLGLRAAAAHAGVGVVPHLLDRADVRLDRGEEGRELR